MVTDCNWPDQPWSGVYAATLCAFNADESIDEAGLRRYYAELAGVPGMRGLVCNGHTGEIMSLNAAERQQITRILAETVAASGASVKVISGVSAEGSLEAIAQARAAREAGADAILLMPPHHWLRFGRNFKTATGFVLDVAEAADVDVIVHQYPAWTRASYSLEEMKEMVRHDRIVMIKMGTRDMARWLYDYERLKAVAPNVSIVTCHDEFLLPTLLEAADGALIGFAGFAPRLLIELVHAALDGDLATAKRCQATVAPLARLIYDFGEPSCGAHQRMKTARWLAGRFPTPHMRRPLRPLSDEALERIRVSLQEIDVRL